MNWRTKVEFSLGKMGEKITRNPKKIIISVLALCFIFISYLPTITIDTSTEGFLREDDPALIRYEAFKEQFGQDEKIMLVIATENIFKRPFLKKLKALHTELEQNIPHLNDITSLINARNTRGEGEQLIVEDLFENWPKNAQALDEIKKLALNGEMYQNLLINEKANLTTIILEPSAYENTSSEDDLDGFGDEEVNQEDVEFLSDKSKSQMIRRADEIAHKYKSEDFDIFIAGSLAVNDYNKRAVQKDMQKFVKLVLLMMIIFLFIVFRRISGVVLPVFIIVISLLTTMGAMAFSGTAISIPTQIIPSFLLAVGIGATVHILSVFFKHFNTYASKEKAIAHALEHSGLAVIMTSLTTAAGLLSFSTALIAPIADLGIFAAVGILIALINTIVLLPAILAVLPLKPAKEKQVKASEKMDKLLVSIADFSADHAKPIMGISAFLIIVSVYFATTLEFKHDPLSWQPDDATIKVSTGIVDKRLKGSVTMEVIIDTNKDNGLYNSELLHKIDAVRIRAEAIEHEKYFVGKGWSVVEVLKEIHRGLHENSQAYYKITKNDALIPQEFLLFENSGSDDLEDLVDASFSKARLTFKLPWMEASEYEALSQELLSIMKEELGDEVEVTITGMVPLFQRTLAAAMSSMGMSYGIAFVLIGILMIIMLGSVKIGLLSMIPNVLPVVMSLCFMAMVGMPLDMFTMLVGAIIIGLSVDDTVHFFHNYARYHHQGLNVKEAVEQTMLGTGRALIATTIVLSLGFFVYTFASLSNLINFGILTGGAIIVALLSDILLAPALLKLLSHEKDS